MTTNTLPVIEVSGPGRSRGQAHGEALRGLISEHLERWEEQLREDLALSPADYADTFFAETNFLPAIERWTPDLLAEVHGIAEGAGVPFDSVLLRQLSDEEPWFRREKRLGQSGGKGCSSIGYTADRASCVAQNMDTPAWWNGHQILLRTRDERGTEALVFTLAGKISLAGMNNHGLGICCNTLAQLDHARDGLPEDFVVRGFLACKSWKDGIAFLRSVKHASGQNYLLGGPGGQLLDLECSAATVVDYPQTHGHYTVHTNHPLVNTDQAQHQALGEAEGIEVTAPTGGSYDRFAVLSAMLEQAPASREHIASALACHQGPVCRHIDDSGGTAVTLGTLIMDCGPKPTLHVAPGPPCSTEFSSYEFSREA